MKNATQYQKKVKKLLGKIAPAEPPAKAAEDPVRTMIQVILEADAEAGQARQAVDSLLEEFVDYNELRAARIKDVVERVGRDLPDARDKAVSLLGTMNAVFNRQYNLSLEPMREMTKRDLRRHLLELGLSPYASAAMVLLVFGGHAIPVDRSLVECLEIEDCIYPDSELADVQGFLERIISAKEAYGAHLALRDFVAKTLPKVRKRREELARAAEAEAEAQAAEAKARAEAAAKSKAPSTRGKSKSRKRPAAKAAKPKAKKSASSKSRKAASSKKKTASSGGTKNKSASKKSPARSGRKSGGGKK